MPGWFRSHELQLLCNRVQVTDQLEPFGVAANRIYINFFDMPRGNVGWSKRTFAG